MLSLFYQLNKSNQSIWWSKSEVISLKKENRTQLGNPWVFLLKLLTSIEDYCRKYKPTLSIRPAEVDMTSQPVRLH